MAAIMIRRRDFLKLALLSPLALRAESLGQLARPRAPYREALYYDRLGSGSVGSSR